ncbi:MAG TPA: sensor domain-containing diguanylate cyclase [Magnetospirillaceae bacterium]
MPAALAEAGLAYHSYESERQQLLDDTLATARALTQALDRQMTGAEGGLKALGTSPYLTSGDLRAFYAQAKEVQSQQLGDNVVLRDLAGRQILNTLVEYGAPLPAGHAPQFKKIFESDEPAISDVFVGAVTSRPMFSIQIPVRRDGQLLYALSIGMHPERIGEILMLQKIPQGQIAGVLDSSGAVVARSMGGDQFVGRRISAASLDRAARETEGVLNSATFDGTPIVAVFSRSIITKWTVYIAIPRAILIGKLRDSLGWVIAIPLLFAAVALIYVRIIGGGIAQSITGLTKPALALGFGQPFDVPPLYLKEADEVGRALIKASSILGAAQYEAQHDTLTKLANRALFNEMVQQQLVLCQRGKTNLAILYIDLDGFKAVNDAHGHGVGDQLLCSVASRLVAGVRSSDIVARLGGDEFAAMLIHSGTTDAAEMAGKLVESVSAPYRLGKLTVSVSASIGIAGYPESARATPALLRSADEAMYRAKRSGKRRYVVAEPADQHN